MPTGKPTVTDEHKQKYAQIMGTVVKSAAPISPAETQSSRMSALLASLPKPKGIGDKMFIFTGKKKIIVDGKQREEEKVKTVDPAKLEHEKKELEKKKEEEKNTKAETPKQEEVKAETTASSKESGSLEVKAHSKDPGHAEAKKPEEHAANQKKKVNKTVLIAGGVFLGLGVWTFIWMYVFGYLPN